MSDAGSYLQAGRFVAWSESALPDRRDLALLAVEKTRMAIIITDPCQADNPIVLANQAFLDLTGYSSEAVIGRNCRFLQGPETSAATVQCIRDDLAGGRDGEWELINYRKDGTPFWNALQISPLRNENGDIVYYFASQKDVTEERGAVALKASETSLLREVDHRARNALALVQGIVRLSRTDDAAAYARAVQGRVEALALAHGLLAEERWRPVSLERLVAAVVRASDLAGVDFDGPPLGIGPEQVQPLALVLHELLDNARRHGALSVPDGRLHISWQGDAAQVKICLREIGGPPPHSHPPSGFGLTLVDAVTTRQLRGRVTLDWPPEGMNGELAIPAMAA